MDYIFEMKCSNALFLARYINFEQILIIKGFTRYDTCTQTKKSVMKYMHMVAAELFILVFCFN